MDPAEATTNTRETELTATPTQRELMFTTSGSGKHALAGAGRQGTPVAWVQNDAVVIDIVLPATKIGRMIAMARQKPVSCL